MELPKRKDVDASSRPSSTKNHSNSFYECPVARVDTTREIFTNEIDHDIEANRPAPHSDDTNTECRICLGNIENKFSLTCSHAFCKPCVQTHCNTHNLLPIMCPDQECEVPIPVRLLKELFVDTNRLQALIEQFQVRQHPRQFKICPICQSLLQLPVSIETNDLQCGQCQRSFCRLHDTEHLNVLCQNHTATVQTIDAFSKPCSHCGTYLQKSSGCDHVVCRYCNGDFCWQCGTHAYLSGKVRKKCSQCGFNLLDYRYESIHRRRLLLWMPLILPLSIIYSTAMLVLCPITLCCCGWMCWDEAMDKWAGLKKGILLTLTIVFFPFIALLNDFGVHFRYLAEIFPDYEHSEIPYLETNDTTIFVAESSSDETI